MEAFINWKHRKQEILEIWAKQIKDGKILIFYLKKKNTFFYKFQAIYLF